MRALCEALQARSGVRPYVLPPPYARGHFRLYGAHALVDADFVSRVEGGNTFVFLTAGAQERLLRQMDARLPPLALPEPARSSADTLLYEILCRGFVLGGGDAEGLCRPVLDLDDDPRRAARALERLLQEMGARYARCLREGQTFTMLPAAARQVVWYRQTHLDD